MTRAVRAAHAVAGAMLIAASALAPGPAPADPPCVPGSIGPSGCASIRPGDERLERPGVEPAPDFGPVPESAPQPPVSLQALTPNGAVRLPQLDPGVAPAPAIGRDPRALQSFQTPYVFD